MSRTLLAVPLGVALLAWGSGVFETGFDYDEVIQAHAIWLIAQGLVPFRDFFECHPPFVWYAFVPALALLPDGPELLFGLRIFAVLGNFAWFAALLAAARAARPSLRTEWLVAAGAIAASHTTVIHFGTQFRPDAWVWAAAFAALARAIRGQPGFRRAAELGAAGSLCALALPKLALLFPAFVAIDLARRQVSRRPQGREAAAQRGEAERSVGPREGGKASEDHQVGEPIARELAGYALGSSLGIALAVGFLFAVGIDPFAAWDLSIRYHGYVAAHYGLAHGLWNEVMIGDRASLAVAVAGLLAWATWLRHRREAPTPLELAVLAALALEFWLVPFPYIQYSAPVYVLSAIFVPYCGAWADSLAARRRTAPQAILAGACAIAAILAIRPLVAGWGSGDAAYLARVQNAVRDLAPSGERIMVPPPFHPVVRRDALYGLIQTWMPSGVSTEETLRKLALPARERLGTPVYRSELEASHPAVVLFTGRREVFYSAEQTAAIASYLADHAPEYRRVVGLEPALWVRADLVAAKGSQLPAGPHAE